MKAINLGAHHEEIGTDFVFGHALTLVALATLAQDTPSKNTLIMARAADATGLDPHTQTAFASFRLLELIYEPLVTFDANLNLIPALAESWEFSSDGPALTFHLRQGSSSTTARTSPRRT